MSKDKIFSEKIEKINDFVFDEKVAYVFDNMVSRSVPLYLEVQEITSSLASKYIKPGSLIYDLGCSTATTLSLIAKKNENVSNLKLIGVDNSAPMIAESKKKLAALGLSSKIELRQEDITQVSLESCSVVILNYTLMFLKPEKRQELLCSIYSSLEPGGILLFTEKVKHRDPEIHGTLTELYHDFKMSKGYSQLEVSQKRDALENVLIPLTTEGNITLLKSAGFPTVEPYLKWITFVSLIAIK